MRPRRRHTLRTLDPARVEARDIMDFSGKNMAFLGIPSEDPATPTIDLKPIYYRFYGLKGEEQLTACVPFPPSTHGFFYFRRSPHPHVAAGEIRFRVVRPLDVGLPSSTLFSQGYDLAGAEGSTPWRLHLIKVFQHYPALRRLLLKDGFTTPASDVATTSLIKGIPVVRSHHRIMECITDPFLLKMSSLQPTLLILHQEKIHAGCISFRFCKHGQGSLPQPGIRSGMEEQHSCSRPFPTADPRSQVKHSCGSRWPTFQAVHATDRASGLSSESSKSSSRPNLKMLK